MAPSTLAFDQPPLHLPAPVVPEPVMRNVASSAVQLHASSAVEDRSLLPHPPPPDSPDIISLAMPPSLPSPAVRSLPAPAHSDAMDTITSLGAPSVSYPPLVEGETITSEEDLHGWKAICNAALTKLPAQGSTVSIKANTVEAATECLNMYILYLHTPQPCPLFHPPSDTTCAWVSLTAFLQDHHLYQV
jgi:hypothetical protein